jgi:putative transcriptional regulator
MTKKAKKTKAKTSRLTSELLETARDMRASGLLSAVAHEKITKRHLKNAAPAAANATLTAAEIKGLREQSNLSQAVFAHYLQVTPGYVSQLERGAKRPTGPALVLLNVIRRRGIGAIIS